jgi:hypothetical protein
MAIPWEAIITAVASLVGVYFANRKSAAVMELRMKMLEEKVSKHNQIVERMYIAEGKITELEHDVGELKGRA